MLPFADTAAMNDHLGEISRAVAPGAHAVLLLDKAGWHRAAALVVPDNISLVLLPSYSPELNPVENVWQYLRANWLSISVFDDYDAIVTACCAAWNRFADQPDLVSSITSRQWAQVNPVGPLVQGYSAETEPPDLGIVLRAVPSFQPNPYAHRVQPPKKRDRQAGQGSRGDCPYYSALPLLAPGVPAGSRRRSSRSTVLKPSTTPVSRRTRLGSKPNQALEEA